MSSRRAREKLREARIARDVALEKARNAREKREKVAEDIDLEPKKKSAKSKNRAPQGKKK